MPETQTVTLKAVGVDYLTVTAARSKSDSSLYEFGRWLVAQTEAHGAKVINWRMSGYRGLHGGSVSVGQRYDGCILRLSSDVAAEHWAQAYQLSANQTRIDLQYTIQTPLGPARTIQKHYQQVKRGGRGRGRPGSYKLYVGPDGPESLFLGSRASERYGRIYNKHLESGDGRWRDCVRYELELKGDAASRCCAELDAAQHQAAEVVHRVRAFALDRGTSAPAVESLTACVINEHVSQRSLYTAPDCARTLEWFRNSVRPSIERLNRAGLGSEIEQALGLRDTAL